MLSILATSAYDAGSFAGVAALAALLVALIVRVARAAPAPAPAPVAAGYASALAPEVRPVQTAPRGRTSDVIAICVVAVLLVGGLLNLAGQRAAASDPWSTAEGRNMSAGFVDGCTDSARGAIDCRCLFEALRKTPAYATPQSFVALGGELERAGGDVTKFPPAYLDAVKACSS